MDSRRRSYLRALDIDVWERRSLEQPGSAQLATDNSPIVSSASGSSASGVQQAARSMDVGSMHVGSRGIESPGVESVRLGGPVDLKKLSVPSSSTAQPPASAAAMPVDDGANAARVANFDWSTLEAAVKSCTLCPLHSTRTQGVFGVGNRTARWLIIGEAPGADEDRQGEPFVGRAGQLLNSMLKAIGLQREEVFIANILKSRPPNNRDPRPEEVRTCIPYLFRQIELVNPRLILCVGRIAAQTLLETTTTIGKLRGRLHQLASGRPMVVTYHPAYLLRSPVEKRKAWADLVLAMQTFERLS